MSDWIYNSPVLCVLLIAVAASLGCVLYAGLCLLSEYLRGK